MLIHFQQRMSWFPQRWRTQRNAIRHANCRIQWVIKSLNATCTSFRGSMSVGVSVYTHPPIFSFFGIKIWERRRLNRLHFFFTRICNLFTLRCNYKFIFIKFHFLKIIYLIRVITKWRSNIHTWFDRLRSKCWIFLIFYIWPPIRQDYPLNLSI